MNFPPLTMCIPSRASAARVRQAAAECWANSPAPDFGGLAPYELAQTPAGKERLSQLLSPVPEPLRADMRAALLAVPAFAQRLTFAFARSGGLLNIFLDRPAEADDELWAALTSGGQAVTEETCQAWNHAPSDLFSGLTPAEVAVGGGPREAALLRECMSAAEKEVQPPAEGWDSEGEGIKAFSLWLRRWQATPLRSLANRSPMEAVFQERQALVRRRLGVEVASPGRQDR